MLPSGATARATRARREKMMVPSLLFASLGAVAPWFFFFTNLVIIGVDAVTVQQQRASVAAGTGAGRSTSAALLEKRRRGARRGTSRTTKFSMRGKYNRRKTTRTNFISQKEALLQVPHHLRQEFALLQEQDQHSHAGTNIKTSHKSRKAASTSSAATAEIRNANKILELNKLYSKHFAQLDETILSCNEKKLNLQSKLKEESEKLKQKQQQSTQQLRNKDLLYKTVQELQDNMRISVNEIEKQKQLCEKQASSRNGEILALSQDEQLVGKFQPDYSTCDKTVSSPPKLLECTLPDGSLFFTFANGTLHNNFVRKFASKTSKELLSLNLMRILYSSEGAMPGDSALLQISTSGQNGKNLMFTTRGGHDQQHSSKKIKPHFLLQNTTNYNVSEILTAEEINDGVKCAKHAKQLKGQDCGLYQDLIATFEDSVRDSKITAKQELVKETEKCDKATKDFEVLSSGNKAKLLQLQAELQESVQYLQQYVFEAGKQKTTFEAVSKDIAAEVLSCENSINAEKQSLEGLKMLYKTATNSAGGAGSSSTTSTSGSTSTAAANNSTPVQFMGNCEVSPFVADTPCVCTVGKDGVVKGKQTLSREIVNVDFSVAGNKNFNKASSCPPLKLVDRSCDCSSGSSSSSAGQAPSSSSSCRPSKWSEWSECTQQCGTGLQSRTRTLPTGSSCTSGGSAFLQDLNTVEEQECNTHPCDLNCELSEWTAWSGCTKQCRTGHQVRRREHVLQQALGDNGKCWKKNSKQRLELQVCNTNADCVGASGVKQAVPSCSENKLSASNLLFLVDGSGSMQVQQKSTGGGSAGATTSQTTILQDVQTFLLSFAKRMNFFPTSGVTKNKIGLITFADRAEKISLAQVNEQQVVQEADLKSAIVEKLPKSLLNAGHSTNLAAALSLATNELSCGASTTSSSSSSVGEFCQNRESSTSTTAIPTVFIITDGMPRSKYLATMEMQKLGKIARVFFLTIGNSLNKKVLKNFATFPSSENFYHVLESAKLKEVETVTDIMANFCTKFA
ncbi:unnamed protein product [Amoebophrya sp. A120]|nr:unnamed protein product [Amoebophrya sp. A120]|eukprot:GSA120T00004666001.1